MSARWRRSLARRRPLGVNPEGDTIAEVLDAWRPGLRARPPAFVTHLIGTNGKGSTATMLAHGLQRHGRGPVGLYTSPHLHRIGERIRVDGRAIDDPELDAAIDELERVERALGVQLSFFEALTAAAVLHFSARGCAQIVLEAGLGGASDATFALRCDLSLVTRVALDHQRWLGSTLEQVARAKATAIRPGVPVISMTQDPRVWAVLAARCAELGSPLSLAPPARRSPLRGRHQLANAGLALAALGHVAPELAKLGPESFDGVRHPARLERVQIGPGETELWLDVAHNLDGVLALCAALDELELPLRAIVLGARPDKPAREMAEQLRRRGPLWWVGTGEGPPPPSAVGEGEPSFESAADERLWARLLEGPGAGRGPVLVCGSHQVVAPARARALGLAQTRADPSDPLPRSGSSARR